MRIAITGVGMIAPAAPAPIDRFDTAGLASHSAALVRDFKPRDFIAPMKLRRMNQLSRLTVSAARLALGERKLPVGSGVASGPAFGTVQTSVDRRRDGFVPGEGSAVLVAEAEPTREPIGWLSGFGIGRDTTATTSDWGSGDARVAEVMRAALDDAGVAGVDAIFASANGSRRGD